MNGSRVKLIALVLISFIAGHQSHKVFSVGAFIRGNTSDGTNSAVVRKLDSVFSDISQKVQVPCPSSGEVTVILGFGQSNGANHAGHSFQSAGGAVFNFFQGKCYVASDPMLGATGLGGSVWIPFAEQLERGKVVLATFGVTGTEVSQWLDKNGLFPFYEENVKSIKSVYPDPDMAVWIQGESEVDTDPKVFEEQLSAWVRQFKQDFPRTKLFLTGTSYCWRRSSESVIEVQRKVAKALGAGFIGVTDNFTESKYRYDDCHFSEQGIRKLAKLLADGVDK